MVGPPPPGKERKGRSPTLPPHRGQGASTPLPSPKRKEKEQKSGAPSQSQRKTGGDTPKEKGETPQTQNGGTKKPPQKPGGADPQNTPPLQPDMITKKICGASPHKFLGWGCFEPLFGR